MEYAQPANCPGCHQSPTIHLHADGSWTVYCSTGEDHCLETTAPTNDREAAVADWNQLARQYAKTLPGCGANLLD